MKNRSLIRLQHEGAKYPGVFFLSDGGAIRVKYSCFQLDAGDQNKYWNSVTDDHGCPAFRNSGGEGENATIVACPVELRSTPTGSSETPM